MAKLNALQAMLARKSDDDEDVPPRDDDDLTTGAATALRSAPAGSATARAPANLAAQAARPAAAGGAAARPVTSALAAMLSRSASSAPSAGAPQARTGAAAPRPWVPRAEQSAPAAKPRETHTLEGHVESVRMFGEDWGIASVWVSQPSQRQVSVVGAQVAQLREGMDYALTGTWSVHPKHGERFDLDVAQPQIPPHPGAIAKFIHTSFDGVGPKTAARFVKSVMEEGGDAALEDLRRKLLSEPWSVDLSPVMRKGRSANFAGEHKQAALAAFVHRELALRVGAIEGMRDNVLKALSGWLAGQIEQDQQRRSVAARQEAAANGTPYVPETGVDMKERAWSLLCADPYKAIGEVPGYGFVTADKIGTQAQIPFDSPTRLAALVSYAQLEMSERAGHVFLTRDQLTSTIKRIDARVNVDDAVEAACKTGTVVRDVADIEPDSADGTVAAERFYHPRMLKSEQALAGKLAQLLEPANALAPQPRQRKFRTVNDRVAAGTPQEQRQAYEDGLRARIRDAAKSIFPQGLDESQELALFNLLSSRTRLHTLTAGPGCGKTAMMEVLVKVLSDKQFNFCAPTGKASKVLTARLQRLGQSCSTIHSLLQGSGPGDFRVSADDPLGGDVLVIDESSMPDLELANALLSAVPDDMHVIFLGDTRQLPSISPGQVLSDILAIEGADHNRLTKTHRNSGGILDVVNEIGQGQLDTKDRESVAFSHGLADASLDFPAVMAAYIGAASRVGIERAVLIMPRRQGEADAPGWNTTYANAVLRQVINPGAPKIVGTSLTVGDRVIIRENMSLPQPTREELEGGKPAVNDGDGDDDDTSRVNVRVVNGDTGTIKNWVAPQKGSRQGLPQWITVDLDDGRRVHLPGTAASDLGLAYALTVHAAQGSEYAEVIMVVTPGTAGFMNRNMIFTGCSRARDRLSIFGEDRVLQQVAKTALPSRNTALAQRVAFELNHEDDGQDEKARTEGPGGDAANEPHEDEEVMERQRFG